jgi:dipeptidyl aminopeptidase/acylaminoacyl peptidase
VSEPAVAPYGTWRSSVGPELVARATTIPSGARLIDDAVWWLELRPHAGGRTTLVRSDTFGEPADVTPEGFDVRTLVHEYGGGAYTAAGSTAFMSGFADQRLYRLELGGEPVAITPEPPTSGADRFADMDVSPDGAWIACVRERHHEDGRVTNEIVTLPSDGSSEPRVVASGGDFVSTPRFSPEGGRLAWLRWDFPRMPWDGTELLVAPFEAGGLARAETVAGGERESIVQPAWSPEGVLHYVSDRTDWWNVYRREDDGTSTNLTPQAAEFGVPGWEFRYASYAFLGDGRIVCAYRRSGTHHLGILDPLTLELLDLDVPYGSFSPPFVSASGSRIAVIGAGPTAGREVVLLDVESRSVDVLRAAEDLGLDPSVISVAEPVEFPTDDGRTAHAYFYPPTNPAFRGPADERPPLVVKGHGGPTSETTPDLKAAIQFFTSRGFAVVDVNYGGSTGYGREYRERLYGTWGVVDVRDCIAAARHLAAEGRVDGDRMVVTGGSAGGYIVLAAMAFHPTAFAAGTSYFGVADLEPFATDTHKFESKYIDVLVGPWPEAAELWRERSPINRADAIQRPLLLLQGLEDVVVPPSQSEVMVRALEARRVPHAYLAFEGEQHGFRRAETIVRSLQAELAFYGKVLGFEPADELPALDVRFLTG